jgi:hypothetical protein
MKNRWEKLWVALEVKHMDRRRQGTQVAAKDFSAFERRWRFKLPQSYKEFVTLFGAGALGGQNVLIAAPGYRGCSVFDLDEINSQGPITSLAAGVQYDDPLHVRRLVFFAASAGDDYFGWDSTELTDSITHEHRIYVAPHGETRLRGFAKTFESFIDATGITGRKRKGPFAINEDVRMEFTPAGRR